jgi:glycosyltransferase involved in cell wall biosynthesis
MSLETALAAGIATLGSEGATPLRIGLYSSTLPGAERKPGGADVHVDRLAERLARRGHDVVVFTYSTVPNGRTYEVRTLTPSSLVASRARRMLLAPARLNQLDTRGLDVLHLHGDDWFYVRREVPTVRTFHGSALYEARFAARARRRLSQYAAYGLELTASRLATGAYGVSPRVGPRYRIAGHLPLGIDVPDPETLTRPGPPTVLFVGTWAGRKRGSLLRDAFLAHTARLVPDARLVMVSDHCEPALGVSWARRPSDDELTELYRSAWLFCMPSLYEGFGIPYLEAMAQGTPVIATSNPGANFVLEEGRCGLIASERELGVQIAALLSDEPARLALARAGRQRAKAFSWEAAIVRHERAYHAAIARFNSGSRQPVSVAPANR